jgi:regulator of protease activity HflC (stomatin/prohibitin superfamily)
MLRYYSDRRFEAFLRQPNFIDFSKIFALCVQILSKDSVTVAVDAVVYFNVIDAEQALCTIDDFR